MKTITEHLLKVKIVDLIHVMIVKNYCNLVPVRTVYHMKELKAMENNVDQMSVTKGKNKLKMGPAYYVLITQENLRKI